MTQGARRSVVFLFFFAVLLSGANFFWTSGQVGAANSRAQAECQADADIAGAPVTMPGKPPAKPPLGVKIISDFRVAWHQAGCRGVLPAPDPTFVRWAGYYRLPAG